MCADTQAMGTAGGGRAVASPAGVDTATRNWSGVRAAKCSMSVRCLLLYTAASAACRPAMAPPPNSRLNSKPHEWDGDCAAASRAAEADRAPFSTMASASDSADVGAAEAREVA